MYTSRVIVNNTELLFLNFRGYKFAFSVFKGTMKIMGNTASLNSEAQYGRNLGLTKSPVISLQTDTELRQDIDLLHK